LFLQSQPRYIAVIVNLILAAVPDVLAAAPAPMQTSDSRSSDLGDAQRLFYTGRYEDAAAAALALRGDDATDLAAYELRSSALLFQLRRALGESKDPAKALAQCAPCADLMTEFRTDIDKGREMARAKLKADPKDETARFFLGKLNLNYVWLQLGTLGRRTGWDEYWEARHSLDAVLKQNPKHVRARVARAWIDYIVDTRMPWGTEWILGGGDKKKALKSVGEAARVSVDFFDQTEASFALWDMQVREKNFKEAVVVAEEIAHDFPENREVARFLEIHRPKLKP
jgi:hypothetical protein